MVFPSIDLITIGAGGGTIAWIDEGGVLKSGPASAGSAPGPACYGAGGTEATNTDANMVLGALNPEGLAGGAMKLRPELAQDAVQRIAERLGMDVTKAANGIITVSNANMVQAMRQVTTERGYDPREFALVAFGGAGPLALCRTRPTDEHSQGHRATESGAHLGARPALRGCPLRLLANADLPRRSAGLR